MFTETFPMKGYLQVSKGFMLDPPFPVLILALTYLYIVNVKYFLIKHHHVMLLAWISLTLSLSIHLRHPSLPAAETFPMKGYLQVSKGFMLEPPSLVLILALTYLYIVNVKYFLIKHHHVMLLAWIPLTLSRYPSLSSIASSRSSSRSSRLQPVSV